MPVVTQTAKTALAKNLTALFCKLKKHRNISCSRLQTLPPALSRQKDDKRIPAQLLNIGKSRRRLQPKRKDIAKVETFQKISLFGLVRDELKGLHMDSQNHAKRQKYPRGMGDGTPDWGQLVSTKAAWGDIAGRQMYASLWNKPPNLQDMEENLDIMRKEKMNSHLALCSPVFEVTLPGKVFYHSETNVACKWEWELSGIEIAPSRATFLMTNIAPSNKVQIHLLVRKRLKSIQPLLD